MNNIKIGLLCTSLLFGFNIKKEYNQEIVYKDDIYVLSSSSIRNQESPCLKIMTSIPSYYLDGDYQIGFITTPLKNITNVSNFTLKSDHTLNHIVNNDEYVINEKEYIYSSYLDLSEDEITTTFAIRSYVLYEDVIYYSKDVTTLNYYRICEKIEIADNDKESILALASKYKSKNDMGFVFTYDDKEDVYEISSYSQEVLQDAMVPSYYKGKWVKRISNNAFSNCTLINTLTIPYSLEEIKANAFNNATLTILCEGKEYSSSWDVNFNPTYCPIYFDITSYLKHDEYISKENITLLETYIHQLIKQGVKAFNQENNPISKFHYSDALMMTALLNVYDVNHNPYYLNETVSYMNNFINLKNSKWIYKPGDGQLDSVPGGDVLLRLSEITDNTQYATFADTNLSILNKMGRIDSEGRNFYHKSNYAYQVWLDGLFMAMPFYTRYEARYNNHKNYEDIYKQYKFVYDTLRNKENGLYYHGYDHSGTQSWSKKNTSNPKCSLSFWGRGIGWLVTSLVNVIDEFDTFNEQEEEYKVFLSNMLLEAMESVYNYVDEETYLFYQVVDKQNEAGNYLETSASSLICYAALKGSRLGILSEEYYLKGLKTFNGIVNNKLKFDEKQNRYVLNDVNKVAGLGGTSNRDGTYEYYISESIVSDNAKGSGPFIMAYSELLR